MTAASPRLPARALSPLAALSALALLAACAYQPTRRTLRAPSRDLLDGAVLEALSQAFPGVEERREAEGRTVSRPKPDPGDPRGRIRGYVRVRPLGSPVPGRDGVFEIEVTVARERFATGAEPRPAWVVKRPDRAAEGRLAEGIERALARRTEAVR